MTGAGMAREEAIRTLKELKITFQHDFGWNTSTLEAIEMAIKALDQITDLKEAYNKGYKDGQEALAFHLELCKEEGSVITVPEGATNGDMIKVMFPNAKIEYHNTFVRVIIKTIGDNYVSFNYDVWNSPYRKEQE